MSAQPVESHAALLESEYRALYTLCYKKEDVAAMEPALARQKIAKRIYKPGSKKAIEQNIKQTGLPVSAVPVDNLTNKAIEERNAGKDDPVEVLVSEWYNKNSASCAEGKGTIFDVVARPVIARFPALSFRWLDPGVVARLGNDDFEPFYDPETGKRCEVGNQYLAFRPMEVSEKRERDAMEANASQIRSVTSEVRAQNYQLEQQNYGGAYKDDVRMTRDDGRTVRL